jgi:hypothetical protein
LHHQDQESRGRQTKEDWVSLSLVTVTNQTQTLLRSETIMRHSHRRLRSLALPCLIAAAMSTPTAWGQVTYTFTGEPFTSADPPYSIGDRVVGSIELAEVLPPFMPPTEIAALLLDFTFADGVQTRLPATTDVCSFEVATDGVGNISDWRITLRQSPFPGVGNPVQTIDLIGPIPGPGIDQVGEGPAPVAPCETIALTFSAFSSAAGSWTSTAVPPPTPTVYTFTGEPFTHADPPYSLGGRVTGGITLAGPLAPLMPMTDLTHALADFGFADGIQNRIPANTEICAFEVATDAVGNLVNWRIVLQQSPFPGPGNPLQVLDLVGPSPGPGFDQVGEGPAPVAPCGMTVLTFYASSSGPGSWSSTAVPPATPTEYFYTGEPFTYADPPYALGGRVTGDITVAGPLPPNLPLTDISLALEDFTFADGIQTRTPANTNVCAFQVATDAAGDISNWSLYLREDPFPGAGNPVQSLDSNGPATASNNDLVGEGPAGPVPCDSIALSLYASSSNAGSWVTIRPVAAAIPAVSPVGAVVLVVLLALAATAAVRSRSL